MFIWVWRERWLCQWFMGMLGFRIPLFISHGFNLSHAATLGGLGIVVDVHRSLSSCQSYWCCLLSDATGFIWNFTLVYSLYQIMLPSVFLLILVALGSLVVLYTCLTIDFSGCKFLLRVPGLWLNVCMLIAWAWSYDLLFVHSGQISLRYDCYIMCDLLLSRIVLEVKFEGSCSKPFLYHHIGSIKFYLLRIPLLSGY